MESLNDLEIWKNQLAEEEELLTKLITQIDQQINSLQVEQMELKNSMRHTNVESPVEEKPQNHQQINVITQKLDLTIPAITKNDMEEDEEEDDEDL